MKIIAIIALALLTTACTTTLHFDAGIDVEASCRDKMIDFSTETFCDYDAFVEKAF